MLDSSPHFETPSQTAPPKAPDHRTDAAPDHTEGQRASRIAAMVLLWVIGLTVGAIGGFVIALFTGLLEIC